MRWGVAVAAAGELATPAPRHPQALKNITSQGMEGWESPSITFPNL